MRLPRIMIAAPKSGSGKTLITCGLLALLKESGQEIRAYKCGPDFSCPMFHKKVLETKSYNLDPFLAGQHLQQNFLKHIGDATFAVMEGQMGYYDGVAGISLKSSSYEVAKKTGTPVILVLDARGTSLSLIALLKGFMEYQENNHIKGVILNRISPNLYPRLKEQIESELPIKVCGYVPDTKKAKLLGRKIGFVLPQEIPELRERIYDFAHDLRMTLDLETISNIARKAMDVLQVRSEEPGERTLRVALAEDEAFCFMYQDNLTMLEENGIELVRFSPLHDKHLPEDIHGLILCGGYPERNAQELQDNYEIRKEIKEKIADGLPCLAENGGYLYLHETLEDPEGEKFEMVGAIEGNGFHNEKLVRFGYVDLMGSAFGEEQMVIRAHESHYYDVTKPGNAMVAKKPLSEKTWQCMVSNKNMLAGFAHLYYPSQPYLPRIFAKRCREYKENHS
ncbi:cobyrinate a,c-diamide synthase [Eubacterium oxidoreducens]|uniref:Cobyrinic acid a,c-diamide synthase n=1 Tax=Eubacterium oxidoreducens TaxID=1732 RepID=A0A1G6BT10_EUBOX|nr:cobyrinate a,c-diamide synthase [Eubacterium oxidoreducens]SDB23687.1 cobyrinic acid a,c-diamide synthase [Eubacterium oxidoreducens]